MGHRVVQSAFVSSALLALVGVARVSSGQSGFEVVHAFPGGAGYPVSRLLQADDGVFYGTVPTGGPAAAGLVFALRPTADGGVRSVVLHVFDGTDGNAPIGDLIQARDGALYGTTSGEAGGAGTVFKITTAGQLTTLHRFDGSDGLRPTGGLVQAPDGSFWGTTEGGGASNDGTIFRMTSSGALTTVHSFTGSDGAAPIAGLLLASDGNFYGTTALDFSTGSSDSGAIFRITPQGELTKLHSFVWSRDDPLSGKNPFAALVEGRDGVLYGTARHYLAGPSVAFSLSKDGVFTTLATIDSLVGGLTQGRDGDFYGVSGFGGSSGMGAIFRMTPAGAVTTVHSFDGTDGRRPFAPLAQGRDGAFYGTTFWGGSSGHGTVFRVTMAGDFAALGSFVSRDGDAPQSSLILAADGNLYGTTLRGGPNDQGAVFRMSPSGAVTFLHFFSGADGAFGFVFPSQPIAGLVQASDGAFYGTTPRGGANGRGTVFRITADGAFTLVHSFAAGEGRLPSSALAEAAGGNLYGTASEQGPAFHGTVFRLQPGP